MIIIYVGGVGSGKTISMVRNIYRTPTNHALCNFDVKAPNYTRLRWDHIIRQEETEGKKGKIKIKETVNWPFWSELRDRVDSFSIYLDEAGSFISSRRSQSKQNVLMSEFLKQIRKVTSDSEQNHFYLAVQILRQIDIDYRQLAHVVCECSKMELSNGEILIVNKWYDGAHFYDWGTPTYTTYFDPKPYYDKYRTLEFIDFESGEEFL